MTTNADLRSTYDAQYASGYTDAHTPVDTWEEGKLIHWMGGNWTGKEVLEIGCGEGRLAAFIAASGANVWALDYSEEAIRIAKSKYRLQDTLEFEVRDDRPLECSVDVIVMQGVLEHQDDWRQYLAELTKHLKPGGCLITSSPSFLNPRGYIWQTLRLLFNVPMSLTDLHAINLWDMQAFAAEHGLRLTYESCHHDWAAGELLLTDYAKRLPKALAEAELDGSRVPELLGWLAEADKTWRPAKENGATMVYKLEAGGCG